MKCPNHWVIWCHKHQNIHLRPLNSKLVDLLNPLASTLWDVEKDLQYVQWRANTCNVVQKHPRLSKSLQYCAKACERRAMTCMDIKAHGHGFLKILLCQKSSSTKIYLCFWRRKENNSLLHVKKLVVETNQLRSFIKITPKVTLWQTQCNKSRFPAVFNNL